MGLSKQPHLHTLTELSLTYSSNFTSKTMICLLTKCVKLRILNVFDCNAIDDECNICIANHCSKLRNLDIQQCTLITDISLFAFASNLLYLEQLNVEYCHLITDNGINELIECNKTLKIECDSCDGLSKECKEKVDELNCR